MFHEYAVEPEAMAVSWDTFRYIIEKFGVDRGRVISRFPKNWEKRVIDSAASLAPIAKSRLIEKLRNTKRCRIQYSRPYDPKKSWQDNALQQHKEREFHAIIVGSNADAHDYTLLVDEMGEEHPLIKVSREKTISRTTEALVEAATPLLENSREIIFLDPHFKPTRPKWTNVLSRFLSLATNGKREIRKCEYHFNWEGQELPQQQFESHRNKLSKLIPDGLIVTFVAWKKRARGEKFHARYILTEIGGIGFDVGLDHEIGHEGQTTDVRLLGRHVYERRWSDLQRSTAAFDLVYEIPVKGTRHISA